VLRQANKKGIKRAIPKLKGRNRIQFANTIPQNSYHEFVNFYQIKTQFNRVQSNRYSKDILKYELEIHNKKLHLLLLKNRIVVKS